tara:strand:+ start:755 stop:1123 length:369 start_codon:yes stop_codon:yes gene_type:complete
MKTYKIPNDVDLKDVQKVPSMENYEGLVLVTTADVGDVDELEMGKLLDGKAVVFNSSNTMFVFNCAHALWQNKTYKKQIDAGLELTQGVEKIVDDSLDKYLNGTFVVEPELSEEWKPVEDEE